MDRDSKVEKLTELKYALDLNKRITKKGGVHEKIRNDAVALSFGKHPYLCGGR